MTATSKGKRSGRPQQSSDIPLAGSRGLDRGSPVPLYFQLAEILTEIIEAGTWQPGARFASQREIEWHFKVSRTVIRPALELLVGDGLIVRVRGSGAFIAPPKREVFVTGLAKALFQHPGELPINVLSAQQRDPDRTVARFLELDRDPAPIAEIIAVIDPGQRSAFLVYSFSSLARVPWLLQTAEALIEAARPPEPGPLELGRAAVSVEGTFFSRWSAAQLGVSPGDPALTGRLVQFGRVDGSERELPLEFARVLYRADSAQLTIEVD